MYAYRGSLHWIDSLLKKRGEFYSALENSSDNNQKSYASLFPNREIKFFEDDRLLIGPLENIENPTNKLFLHNALNIRFVKLYQVESVLKDESTNETFKRTFWKPLENEDDDTKEVQILRKGLKIMFDRKGGDYQLDELDRKNDLVFFIKKSNSPTNVQFVRTVNTDEEIAQVWDHIASTDKEKYLVEALKLIEKDVESLDFVKDESSNNERKAVVRIRQSRIPLKSMGDGMNRILTIILALVNAEGGYLLVDEFENGLHYSVQEDLWKMVFHLAKRLDVQVFATTHSNDCIRAFENVLNEANQSEGLYFRLEKFELQGKELSIKPVFYAPSELEVAVDQHIETR